MTGQSTHLNASDLLEVLFDRLRAGREDVDFEVKAAQGGLPSSMWPTVSAFANTRGGWIMLGVAEAGTSFAVEGIPEPERLLQDFYNLLRNPQKISTPACGAEDAAIQDLGEERKIIVIRIPAASRMFRPVYVNGNPYTGTYVRRNSGDYLCNKQEVDRMMREASAIAADSAILSDFWIEDLDQRSIATYRRTYLVLNRANAANEYDDEAFLRFVGALGRDRGSGREGATVAGLLMLGKEESIREWRARHLIDYRFIDDLSDPAARWEDRIAWNGNLLGAYETIYPRLIEGQSVPFRLERGTRVAEGPVHVALREALVNLLVHADYAESQASLVFRSPDGHYFRNPGSSRVPQPELTQGRSDPRNPLLMQMFRFVGIAEEAGTGIPNMFHAWRQLGFHLPAINVGTEQYQFTVELRHSHFISEDDRTWLHDIGGTRSEAEQLMLVLARHGQEVTNQRMSKMLGLHRADVTKMFRDLCSRKLLENIGFGRGSMYQLGPAAQPGSNLFRAERMRLLPDTNPDVWSAQSRQVAPEPPELNAQSIELKDVQSDVNQTGGRVDTITWTRLESIAAFTRTRRFSADRLQPVIVALCGVTPLSLPEIAVLLGRSEDHVRALVKPLLADGTVTYLYPDRPSHPRQQYTSTEDQSVSVTLVQA